MPSSTRTVYAGTIVATDPITAANNNKLPGGCNAWSHGVSDITGIDNTGYSTIIACSSVPLGTNRLIKVSLCCPYVEKLTSNGNVKIELIASGGIGDGGAISQSMVGAGTAGNAGNGRWCATAHWIFNSGTAGSYSFTASALTSDAGGARFHGSNDNDPGPMTLVVEDMGPVFGSPV